MFDTTSSRRVRRPADPTTVATQALSGQAAAYPTPQLAPPAPTMVTPTRVAMGALELSATRLGTTIPFPLRAPSAGPLDAQHKGGYSDTTSRHHQVAADTSSPQARELAVAFKHRWATIDLIVTCPEAMVGVVSVLHPDGIVLCRQRLDGTPAAVVDIRPVELGRLVDEFVDLIPARPAATMFPVRVSMAAVHALHSMTAADGDIVRLLKEIATHYRCAIEDLEDVIRAGARVSGLGQLGATVPSGKHIDLRVDRELSWLDSPTGRLRVNTHHESHDEWVTITPLRRIDLRSALTELITRLYSQSGRTGIVRVRRPTISDTRAPHVTSCVHAGAS